MTELAEYDASADAAGEQLLELVASGLKRLEELSAWLAAWRLRNPDRAVPPSVWAKQADLVDWLAVATVLNTASTEGALTAGEQLAIGLAAGAAGGFIVSGVTTFPALPAAESLRVLFEERTGRAIQAQTSATLSHVLLTNAINYAKAGVSAEVVSAFAQGQRDVAEANGGALVWHGERNACLSCLGYVGAYTAAPADVFHSAGFDGTKRTSLARPPVHPHCRCQLVAVGGDPVELAEAYRREAVRSVLKGWRLESESEAARLRAVERLLGKGNVNAPKSVVSAARKAINEGGFPGDGLVPA